MNKKEVLVILTPAQAESLRMIADDYIYFMYQEFAETGQPFDGSESFNIEMMRSIKNDIDLHQHDYTNYDLEKELKEFGDKYSERMKRLANEN